MRHVIIAAALAACALPAFAQAPASDTLKELVAKGSTNKASMQGQDLELKMTYKADGTYTAEVMGQAMEGKYRIDGDKLCTISQMSPNESCTPYPAGKKSGDEFDVQHPALGAVKVKIN